MVAHAFCDLKTIIILVYMILNGKMDLMVVVYMGTALFSITFKRSIQYRCLFIKKLCSFQVFLLVCFVAFVYYSLAVEC